ncbi:hypothetical protein I316_01564 [Kwoniella heveanensis BCC8398]|uniref:Uncharacterized protein n=1 Tax=Kwoniella heveanensis BCC8398 TaxID=1296120 RepID=A0A1B9H108_9TREE|nr:hypothetical protein I316_01564 [Kwoniella heveanensis BCC8398]
MYQEVDTEWQKRQGSLITGDSCSAAAIISQGDPSAQGVRGSEEQTISAIREVTQTLQELTTWLMSSEEGTGDTGQSPYFRSQCDALSTAQQHLASIADGNTHFKNPRVQQQQTAHVAAQAEFDTQWDAYHYNLCTSQWQSAIEHTNTSYSFIRQLESSQHPTGPTVGGMMPAQMDPMSQDSSRHSAATCTRLAGYTSGLMNYESHWIAGVVQTYIDALVKKEDAPSVNPNAAESTEDMSSFPAEQPSLTLYWYEQSHAQGAGPSNYC